VDFFSPRLIPRARPPTEIWIDVNAIFDNRVEHLAKKATIEMYSCYRQCVLDVSRLLLLTKSFQLFYEIYCTHVRESPLPPDRRSGVGQSIDGYLFPVRTTRSGRAHIVNQFDKISILLYKPTDSLCMKCRPDVYRSATSGSIGM
jgi:hypothetical protein